MYDQALFVRMLSEFTRHLLEPHDIETALTALAARVTRVLGLAGSGVSLGRGETLVFATAVPEHLSQLEQVQEERNEGPCVTAYREKRVVAAEDLREHSGRWPEYCAVAEAAGVRSVASIPMQLRGITVGSLNLYGDGARSWPDEDLAAATVMADVATAYLITASIIQQQAELNAQLQSALDSRIVIEQAKGILANRHRTSVDTAFERLRDYARAHSTPLRQVAAAVVSRDLLL